MSIEVTGPEKYDFQDHVCLLVALRLRNLMDLQAFIEPVGLEDALFRVSNGGVSIEIELQVKGAQTEVTQNSIAEWLAHFPPRRAEGSLLERLLDSEQKYVLLTATGRCNDDASHFCAPNPWSLIAHAPMFLPIKEAKALLVEISRQHKRKGSLLESARCARCLELSKTVTPRKLREALKRLLIEDQTTGDLVIAECTSILRTVYLIPDDRIDSGIEALLSAIKATKSEARKIECQIDIWPRLNSLLVELAGRSVRPPEYLARGDESEWGSQLSVDGVLLLSGRPRCGKSYAARAVAADFQKMGYEVRECRKLSEAERFLMDCSASQRLCVVDDPLGALQLDPVAGQTLERFRWLNRRIQPNRKLIVAQSQDQLFEVMGKDRLSDCRIGDFSWQDLSISPSDFLSKTWVRFAEDFDVRLDVRHLVERSLKETQADIEIGCLYHLAANAAQLPDNPTLEEAFQLARQDAAAIGSSLARSNAHMRSLLFAIAIGIAPGRPLALAEAAFLLDEADSSLPGQREDLGYVVFGGRGEEDEFPSYCGDHRLSAEIRSQIHLLEGRGFISVKDRKIAFKHAFYEAAARSTLSAPTAMVATLIARLFERALFSLSTDTSAAAIANAGWIIDALKDREGERQQIVESIERGLESIFPAVRDACFEFLLRNMESYGGDREKQLERWVGLAVHINLDDLKWHKGQTWIPRSRRFLSHFDLGLERNKVVSDKALLESDEANSVPPERVALVAQFIYDKPDEASPALVGRLLGSDEALIRAASAAAWVALQRDCDLELLDRIFEDRHPKVLLEVLESCVLKWNGLSAERRAELTRRLAVAVSSKSAAIAVLPRMIVFDRIEYSGKNPPWGLFESLMPVVLSALPQQISFSGPRLYSVMQSAASFCQPKAVVAMCESWIHWIELQIAAGQFEQYELGVTDILVSATRKAPNLRKDFIARLLSIRPTSALIYIVSDVQNSWGDLSQDERQTLLNLLRESRPDRRWLHAVAITRRNVPPEIQMEILGKLDALEAPSAGLLARIPPDLLNAAVAVQCGMPGDFWNIAHCSDTFADVVRIIESDSSHAMFETTFGEVALHDDDARMTKIVESAAGEHLDRIFRLLLNQRVECTGMFLPDSWATLLSRADSERRRNWLHEMSFAAPVCIDDLSKIGDWLKRDEDRRALFELFPNDYGAELLAIKLEKGEIARQMGLEMLKGSIENAPPRFFGTYDHILSRLKKAGIHLTDLLGLIDSARKHCFEERKKIETLHGKEYERPADWVEI